MKKLINVIFYLMSIFFVSYAFYLRGTNNELSFSLFYLTFMCICVIYINNNLNKIS